MKLLTYKGISIEYNNVGDKFSGYFKYRDRVFKMITNSKRELAISGLITIDNIFGDSCKTLKEIVKRYKPLLDKI